MSWYKYYAQGKSTWKPCLAEDVEQVISEENPEFVTVLDVNHVWGKGEQPPADVAYRGSLYLDWDGEDMMDVLDNVKRFMNKLEALKFDVNQAQWWLTGKKGVHCLIPFECFGSGDLLQGFKDLGEPYLPTIYKDMVSDPSLITDCMDLSIYSRGKGRQWRVPNRARTLDDGRTTYKVAIRPEALRALTEQSYWDWCSQPRPELQAASPTYNTKLGMAYKATLSNVRARFNAVKQGGKRVSFGDWAGEIPPTLKDFFDGKGIRTNANLNDIKIQMVIAANAVGLNKHTDENQFIELIRGFINAREGTEGATHKTAAEIEKAMREAFRNITGDSSYVYTVSGMRSVLTVEAGRQTDVTGKKPEENQKQLDMELLGGFSADASGVSVVTEKSDQLMPVSNYSWKPGSLMKINESPYQTVAYSVIELVRGKELPRTIIPFQTLNSPAKLANHAMERGGYFEQMPPGRTGKAISALRLFTAVDVDEAPIAIATTLEGMFVERRSEKELQEYMASQGKEIDVLNPDADLDLNLVLNRFWVTPEEVIPSPANVELLEPLPTPVYLDSENPMGRYGINLAHTPYTLGTTLTPMGDTVNAILELNGNFASLATLIGWFTACNLKHIWFNLNLITNFPILQVYGDAGCGKTTTVNLFMQLFTWDSEFRVVSAGSGLTDAARRSLAAGSASIPLVVDEVKYQNLKGDPAWLESFRQFLQNIYTLGNKVIKAGGRGSTSHHNGLVNDAMWTPVAFMGETLEVSQTSLIERIVSAPFHTADKAGREAHADYLRRNKRQVSIIGWTIVNEALTCDLNKLNKDFLDTRKEVKDSIHNGSNDRITENAIAITAGFRFFKNMVEKYMPNKFTAKLEALEHALLNPDRWSTSVAPEAVKFIEAVAISSYLTDAERARAIRGQHYELVQGEIHGKTDYFPIIDVDNMYRLYRIMKKELGETPVYTSSDELYHALKNSVMTLGTVTDTTWGGNRCLRLNPEVLDSYQVRRFKAH